MKYNFLLKFVSFISLTIFDEIQAKMSNVQPELPLSYEQISVNYPNLPSTVEVGASVIIGECLNLDFRPRVGLTSPPTAETAEPSAFIILMPSALIFAAAFPSRS